MSRPNAIARRGTVILLVLALVSALLLVTTLFLTAVLGQRTSGRHYLRASLARYAAIAGQEHAIAVLVDQYRDEVASGAPTTLASPYRWAFLPLRTSAGTSEMDTSIRVGIPTWGDESETTGNLFGSALGIGSRSSDATELSQNRTMHDLWGLQASTHSGGDHGHYSRFFDHQQFDRNLYPTTDANQAFYRTRYDVLVMNIDPMFHVAQDVGDAAYLAPANRSGPFANSASRMFDGTDAVEHYRRLYARSIASVSASRPSGSYDGEITVKAWSELDGTNPGSARPSHWAQVLPSARVSGGYGDNSQHHNLAHVVFPDTRRFLPWFNARTEIHHNGRDSEIAALSWHTYTGHDAPRQVAGHFLGIGLERVSHNDAERVQFLPAEDRTVIRRYRRTQHNGTDVRDSRHERRDRSDQLGEAALGPGISASPGERSFSPNMGWLRMWSYHTFADKRAWDSQYLPFGSGIVGDASVDDGTAVGAPAVAAGDLDGGGVPWEINPLTAPPRILDRLVLGLTPQLLAAEGEHAELDHMGAVNGNGQDIGDGTVDSQDLVSFNDKLEGGYVDIVKSNGSIDQRHATVTASGYRYPYSSNPGNHQFELFFDPPKPDGSGHTYRAAIDSFVSSYWPNDASTPYDDTAAMQRYAYIAFHPFYDPAEIVIDWDVDYDGQPDTDSGGTPITYTSRTPEHPDKLHAFLDGLKDAAGTATTTDQERAEARFVNRLRYIRWVSYKHEFAVADPSLEQALQELDAPITYEEGLRYYRRPSRQNLRVDVGAANASWNGDLLLYEDQGERKHFDHSAEQQGLVLTSSGGDNAIVLDGTATEVDSSGATTLVKFNVAPADEETVLATDDGYHLALGGFVDDTGGATATDWTPLNGTHTIISTAYSAGVATYEITTPPHDPALGESVDWATGDPTAGGANDPEVAVVLLRDTGAVATNGHAPLGPWRFSEASTEDGEPRYRIYPHTYPGAMWTGREGRREATTDGGAVSGLGLAVVGNGTLETRFLPHETITGGSSGDADYEEIRSVLTDQLVEPRVGMPDRRDWATDSFAWDIAIACFEALAEKRAEAQAGTAVNAEDIDQRMVQILGISGGYGFSSNLVVTDLFNPAEPVDVDGDGLYDPATDTVRVDVDGDGIDDDLDGDGTVDDVPAVRDPEYVYGQYNQYWPVPDPLVPHRFLYDATAGGLVSTADFTTRMNGDLSIANVRSIFNGDTDPAGSYTWRLGADLDEIETEFTGNDWYYDHARALVMASMMLNDFRQSLFGAGDPQTVDAFASSNAGTVAAFDNMDAAGSATWGEIFVAGRNQEPASTTAKPFSRTGRLVAKRDRFYRVVVRAQFINQTLPITDYRDDLTELFLESVVCVDADENGNPSDTRILYQRMSKTQRNARWNTFGDIDY